MAIASTEYTPFSSLTASGVITTDTFNAWRKKTNGLIVLLDGTTVGGGLSSSNLSTGAPSWTSLGETSIFGGAAVTSGNALTIVAGTGSTNGLIITQTGTGAALRVNDITSDTTPLIVDENGHLIVGHTATLPVYNKWITSTISPHISTVGTSAALGASMSIYAATLNTQAGILAFAKSRGSVATPLAIITGDSLGVIDWQGHDGTNPLSAANIECISSGTVASGNVNGALLFSTRNTAGTLAERMRIDSAGLVGIGKTPTVALDVNGAITSSGTVTGNILTNGTVSITGGAISGLTSYSVTGDITATGSGKLKGVTLEIGSSGQLTVTTAGVLSTSGSITSTSGAVTGVGLIAGTGDITTSGKIKSSAITINGNQLNAVPVQTLALSYASATDGSITTEYDTIIYNGRGVAAVTVTGSSKAVTFAGPLSGITTLNTNGAITAGGLVTGVGLAAGAGAITTGSTITAGGLVTGVGLDATSGGITRAGAISNATTIGASGQITCVGLAAGAGAITTSSTITATGQITSGGLSVTGSNNIAAVNGNIATTGGNVTAGGYITAGSYITASGTVTANSFATSGGSGAITCATVSTTGSIYSGAQAGGSTGTIISTKDTQTLYTDSALTSQSFSGDAGVSLLCQGTNAVYLKCTRASTNGYAAGSLHIITHNTGTYANVILNQLDARGDIIAYSTSDRKFKDNIQNITNPLDKVAQINGVSFDWNDKQSTFTGHDIGVIAQEVEAVLPEVVTTRDDGSKAVKYDKMVALLIECVKELKAEIEELKSKVN